MEDQNYGIAQISKHITNLSLFDGKEDAAKAYAEKIKAGNFENLAGHDLNAWNKNMATIKKLA